MDRFQPGRTALSSADGIEAEAGLAVVLVACLVAAVGGAVEQRRVHCGRIPLVYVDGMRQRRRRSENSSASRARPISVGESGMRTDLAGQRAPQDWRSG